MSVPKTNKQINKYGALFFICISKIYTNCRYARIKEKISGVK
jgi:hypothetical protein